MKASAFTSVLALLPLGCGAASTAPTAPPESAQAPMASEAVADAASGRAEAAAEAMGAPAGLRTMDSNNDFAATVTKAKAAIESRGLKLMTQVDHAANAKGVGMELGPTTVFLFGNPKAGTQLMAVAQTAGIDLPMKLIVWQDADGGVHVGYNDPAWIAERHGVTGKDELVGKMQGALSGIASEATAK